jgi:site-specific DNA recombinase
MKSYFAYVRVSTAKQGEQGVSLQQQRDAIEQYAESRNITIGRWFEEQVTAAKTGRRVFNDMLRLLRARKGAGLVIHKIDRSARNLKDWSKLGELIDEGVDVRFTNDSVDLQSRGGRLSADIQAVVAADYIRNLREETKKGFYGRIKQGILPMPAPLGYLNAGRGKPKTPDPATAPLIRQLFDLYASGDYSLASLVDEMYQRGLRTKSGKKIVLSGLSRILANPFYMGLIHLKRSGETHHGIHKPIVPARVFEQTRLVASGKFHKTSRTHDFPFRRLLRCAFCRLSLIGEVQKGHIYYRCHTRACQTKGIRQEVISRAFRSLLKPLQLNVGEKAYLQSAVLKIREQWDEDGRKLVESTMHRQAQIDDRLGRIADAYVDGLVDKELFEQRKAALLMEGQKLKQSAASQAARSELPSRLEKFLELAGNAYLLYKRGSSAERRELLEIVTSNRVVEGKKLIFTLDLPFTMIANRSKNESGDPVQNTARTLQSLVNRLIQFVGSPEGCELAERCKILPDRLDLIRPRLKS